MDDHLKTTDQLLAELTQLRERVAELETASAARVQAEIALRDSETRLRHLTNNMLDVVGLTDRHGVFQYISPSIKTVAGYEPSDIVGRSMFEHVHPDDRYHLSRIATRALHIGQTGRMELRYQHADGHYMTLEAVGTPARDNTGHIIGGVMSARDITERKRAEEQLRLAQLTYLGILNSVTEAIYIQSEDGVFQYVNQAAERLYRYAAAEFIGQTPEFLSAPGKNDLTAVAAQVRDACAGTPHQFEFWGRRRDGSIFPKEVSVTPGSYFGKRVVIAVARDVTARQHTEQALRDSEEKYRTILDNIEDGYYEVDLSGNLTFFNDALRQMLGYPADQLMGLNDRQYTDPVNAHKLYEAFLRVYQTGEPATGFDWEIIRKDGATRIVDASVSLIRDPAGRPIGFRGIVRDITARKQAEEQLQHYEFIVNAADEYMTLVNRQHVLKAVNDAYCRAQGRSRAELIGRSLADVWGEARYHEKIAPYVEQCFAGQIVRYEDTFAFDSGEPRQYQVGMYPYAPAAGGLVTYAAIVTVDVTERVRAEAALRDNEARLRRAEGIAHFGNWEFHLAESKARTSAGARLIYGMQGDEWSITDVQSIPLPEYRAMLDDALTALIEHQTPYDVEFRIRRPNDGELRDIHSLAEYDPVSQTVFGVINDITERKQVERAEHDQRTLAESLSEVATLLNSTLDYSTILDQMLLSIGRVVPHTTANVMTIDEAAGYARVVRARGYDQQGPGLAEQVLRLSLPLMLRNLRTMYDTRQPAIMNDTRNSPDWVITPETAWNRSYLGAPIVLRDRVLGFLNLDSDQPNFFTEEHARRLMSFAAQAAAAIENARLFEAERDARRLAEALRDTAAALSHSLNPDEVLDEVLNMVERVIPGDGAIIMLVNGDQANVARVHGRYSLDRVGTEHFDIEATDNLRTMRDTGEPYILDYTHSNPRWRMQPGDEWIASYAGVPIRMHDELLGFLGLFSTRPGHFSARHTEPLKAFADQIALAIHNAQLHAGIQLYAEELEERVLQRTRELTAANEQLAAANARLTQLDQLKDQFISRISHELRTPLTNIKIYLELLETGKAEKRPKYLATLSTQADRLHELIEDLLEVSQLDMANLKLSLRPFDLNHVATDLLNDKTPAARERGLTLTAHLQAGLPDAHGESSLTFQAAERLMTNALAYTPRGGTVTLKTALQHRADGEWVTLTIQDTGPGVSDKDLPHLFERFYRGEAANDYTVPGTGLGLSITRTVIEKMGGQITMENVPATDGGGAAFTIWLPTAK